ncbi:MAG: hypothetical protein ACP5QN_01930 [Minisyncoccia bacterium]
MPRLYPLEKTRNIGIIAHIDASPFGLLRNLAVSYVASLRFAPIFPYGKTSVFPTPFPHQSAQKIGQKLFLKNYA